MAGYPSPRQFVLAIALALAALLAVASSGRTARPAADGAIFRLAGEDASARPSSATSRGPCAVFFKDGAGGRMARG